MNQKFIFIKEKQNIINWVLIGVISIILFTLFIVGTFLDLQIAQDIYKEKSWYGLAFDKFGQLTFLIPANFCFWSLFVYFKYHQKDWDVQIRIYKIIYLTLIFAGVFFYLMKSPILDKDSSKAFDLSTSIFNILVFYVILLLSIIYLSREPKWLIESDHLVKKVILIAIFIIVISLSTQFFKGLFSRPRPITVMKGIEEYQPWWKITKLFDGKNHSFPSGHVTSAITIIGLALLFDKKDIKFMAFILLSLMSALLVGTSRMVLAKHFLTDVTSATIISIGWFILFYFINQKLIKKEHLHE